VSLRSNDIRTKWPPTKPHEAAPATLALLLPLAVPGATVGLCGRNGWPFCACFGLHAPDRIAAGGVLPTGGTMASSQQAKKPATARSRAGGRGQATLLVDSVRPLPAFRLEGLDGVAGLLHRAGHEPANSVSLPVELLHDFLNRPRLPSVGASQPPGRSCCPRVVPQLPFPLAVFLAFGAFLAAVAFLVAFALRSATAGSCAPAVGKPVHTASGRLASHLSGCGRYPASMQKCLRPACPALAKMACSRPRPFLRERALRRAAVSPCVIVGVISLMPPASLTCQSSKRPGFFWNISRMFLAR